MYFEGGSITATTKKSASIGALLAALKETDQKAAERSAAGSRELAGLTEQYLSRPDREQLLAAYRAGAPLTGPDGIRKQLGAIDLEYFGRAYLPHYFSRPSPDFHRALDAQWAVGVLQGRDPLADALTISRLPGCRIATAAPRGHAKSTNVTLKDVLHAVAYGYKHYPIIISDSSEQAEGALDNIRAELEDNGALIEDFGDLSGPVWRSNVLITTTGIKIEAIGVGKKIRGRKHRNWRPDLIILDDVENDENVRTPEQRRKLEAWYLKAVSKAGDDYTDLICIGTILHYDSLLAHLLHNPAYRSATYRAVLSWAEDSALWQTWEAVYTDLDNPARDADARACFDAHRAEMLQGAEVLWPDKLSYYDLMVMRVSEGESAFGSEMQNEPVNPDDCVFDESWLIYYDPAGLDLRDRAYQFYGFVDPSLGRSKSSDYSAIITIAKHTPSGYMYVTGADIERRHPDRIIADVLAAEQRLRRDYGHGYRKLGAETNQFQWFLKEQLAKASAAAGLYLPIEEVQQTTDKIMRIQSLQPDIKNGYIRFDRRHKRLIEQLLHFPLAAHDDGPDALQGCVALAKHAKRFRLIDRSLLGL